MTNCTHVPSPPCYDCALADFAAVVGDSKVDLAATVARVDALLEALYAQAAEAGLAAALAAARAARRDAWLKTLHLDVAVGWLARVWRGRAS